MNEQERKVRAKSIFWWSFGLCYFVLFTLTLLANRNWRSDYVNSGTFGVFNAFISYIVATIICRKRGVSLEEQKTTKLIRAEFTEKLQDHLKIRSQPLDKTIDLLQKSFMQISDSGDQIESQAEAFSSVSVSAAQDAKAFESSQDVFDANTF